MASLTGGVHEPLMDSSTHDDIDSLDEEIGELQSAISQRRQRRNALQPISRLHPEIFLHIFTFLHPRYNSSIHDFRVGSYNWKWLTLTKICVYWRKLVIEAPMLWAKVGQYDSIKKIEVFLERSKDAELEVELCENDFNRGAFEIIKGHMGRVKQLSIHYKENSQMWNSLQVLLMKPKSCALLKNLIIRSDFSPHIARELQWTTTAYPLKLESLELSHLYTNWNHSIFRGLRRLTILNIRDQSMVPHLPTLSQYLDVLESCSQLEELTLCFAGPRSSFASHDRVVDLTELKKISISGVDFRTYLVFFQHIRFPKFTTCNILCSDHDFTTTDQIIAPSIKRVLTNHFGTLCVELCETSVMFSLSRKGDSNTACDFSIRLFIQKVPADNLIAQVKAMFKSILRIVQGEVFKDVGETKLLLNKFLLPRRFYFPKSMWFRLFKSIPKFKTLTVKKATELSLEQVVGALLDLSQKNTPPGSYFSAPQEIEFIFVRSFSTGGATSILLQYLRSRKTNGFPLTLLRLLDCDWIGETDLRMMEDVVQKVVF